MLFYLIQKVALATKSIIDNGNQNLTTLGGIEVLRTMFIWGRH